jgi:hypothetical protein
LFSWPVISFWQTAGLMFLVSLLTGSTRVVVRDQQKRRAR